MKRTVLAFIFSIFALFVAAQTDYEYASVVYVAKGFGGVKISISTDTSFQQVNASIKEGTMSENLTPVIGVINKMATEGWEVYNNNIITGNAVQIYYFLRRKKSSGK